MDHFHRPTNSGATSLYLALLAAVFTTIIINTSFNNSVLDLKESRYKLFRHNFQSINESLIEELAAGLYSNSVTVDCKTRGFDQIKFSSPHYKIFRQSNSEFKVVACNSRFLSGKYYDDLMRGGEEIPYNRSCEKKTTTIVSITRCNSFKNDYQIIDFKLTSHPTGKNTEKLSITDRVRIRKDLKRTSDNIFTQSNTDALFKNCPSLRINGGKWLRFKCNKDDDATPAITNIPPSMFKREHINEIEVKVDTYRNANECGGSPEKCQYSKTPHFTSTPASPANGGFKAKKIDLGGGRFKYVIMYEDYMDSESSNSIDYNDYIISIALERDIKIKNLNFGK